MSMDDQNSQNANRDIFNFENVQGDVKVVNYDKQPRSRQEFNARKRLLNEMRTELAGRKPLHQAAMLNLGKEQQPHQVQRPWDVSVKVGEQRSFQLPSETSILEVFEEPTIGGKLLILGKAGSGKTTTLLELAQGLCDRAEMDSNAPIPVILELSSWQPITKGGFLGFGNSKEYDPSIKEWILSKLLSKGVSKEIGEQWIRHELVLLLDGLDEMPSERQTKCVKAINQFLDGEFSPLHLIVCSRKEEYENYEEILLLNGAICLEELTTEQMQNYFTSINLCEFWENIKEAQKIVDFIRRPLFLAITSIAYRQIDTEEWKNCTSEQNNIDYLLGIYRIKMLTRITESNWHKKRYLTKSEVTQNRLIRLATVMAQSKSKEFEVNKMGLDWLQSSSQVRLINHICAFISFFIVFLPVNLTFNINLTAMLSPYFFASYCFFVKSKDEGLMLSATIMIVFIPLCFFVTESVLKYIGGHVIYSFAAYLVLFFFFMDDSNSEEDKSKNIQDSYSIFKTLYESFNPKHFFKDGFVETFDKSLKEDPINTVLLVLALAIMGIIFGINYPVKIGSFFLTWITKILISLIAGILFPILFFLMCALFLVPMYIVMLLVMLFVAFLFILYHLLRRITLRVILGLSGDMPWNITPFLDYCTERLILQRVGNRYRFIHRLVQEHFASLEIQKFDKLN
jgi:hypothetical protein